MERAWVEGERDAWLKKRKRPRRRRLALPFVSLFRPVFLCSLSSFLPSSLISPAPATARQTPRLRARPPKTGARPGRQTTRPPRRRRTCGRRRAGRAAGGRGTALGGRGPAFRKTETLKIVQAGFPFSQPNRPPPAAAATSVANLHISLSRLLSFWSQQNKRKTFFLQPPSHSKTPSARPPSHKSACRRARRARCGCRRPRTRCQTSPCRRAAAAAFQTARRGAPR